MPRPILIFAYGNPSRGDDALGPRLIEELQHAQSEGGLGDVALLTDFQLQVEHALDIDGRERVIFVDAAESGPAPFSFDVLEPAAETSYTTHAMRPEAVLQVFTQITGKAPPPAWLLAIRGYAFELGKPPTAQAQENLRAARRFLEAELKT